MSYKFVDNDKSFCRFIDLPEGSVINAEGKQYKIQGGNIFCYELQDGEAVGQGKIVNEINMSVEQISIFSNLGYADNYTDRLDRDDLDVLKRSDLKNTLKEIYGETILINRARVTGKTIKYEVEPDYDNDIEKFFKKIGNFFLRVVGKEENPIIEEKEKDIVEIELGKFKKNRKTVKTMRYEGDMYRHKVEKGESIDSLALRTNIPAQRIIDANPKLWNMEILKPDDKIKIPPNDEREKVIKYRVVEGETWESIAQKYNVTLNDLKQLNKKYRESTEEPSAGSKIIIPKYKHKTKVKESYVETKPERIYYADSDISPITLANDNQMSLYRLAKANPSLILRDKNGNIKRDKNGKIQYRMIKADEQIIIPENKVVTRVEELSITGIAEQVGVSAVYINDIIFRFEGRDMEPVLVAEDDMVPPAPLSKKAKKKRQEEGLAIGTPTIGFGHTNRVRGMYMDRNNPDWKNVRITEEDAYKILANDLCSCRQDAVAYFGESFEKAPQSIQDAIVDIIFNKGTEGFEREDSPSQYLKQDLEKGDYVSAAVHSIVDPTNSGLMRRNVYRSIQAMMDLSDEDREKAIGQLEEYKNKTWSKLKNINLKNELNKHYDLAIKGKKNGFFNV